MFNSMHRGAAATSHDDGRPRCRVTGSPILSRRTQGGLSLIEILVTMVLLGVGLLGLAGLQLRGVQVNQGSLLRSQAAILAEDLADRMRADAATATVQHGYDGQYTPAGTTAPNATVAGLVPDLLYRMQALPAGCAVVDTVSQAPETVITVTWNDTRAARAADATASSAAPTPCVLGATSGSYVLTTE